MCGRYALPIEPEKLPETFGKQHLEVDKVIDEKAATGHRYNIGPTAIAPVYYVSLENDSNIIQFMRWGIIPAWIKNDEELKKNRLSTFNARYENLSTNKIWKQCIERQRCVIPIQGYFEWLTDSKGKKIPYYVRHKENQLIFLAGLYSKSNFENKEAYSYTIITWKAPKMLKWLHQRMPIVIDENTEEFKEWINGKQIDDWSKLLKIYDGDYLEWFKVDPRVGNSRLDEDKFIQPLKENRSIGNFFQTKDLKEEKVKVNKEDKKTEKTEKEEKEEKEEKDKEHKEDKTFEDDKKDKRYKKDEKDEKEKKDKKAQETKSKVKREGDENIVDRLAKRRKR